MLHFYAMLRPSKRNSKLLIKFEIQNDYRYAQVWIHFKTKCSRVNGWNKFLYQDLDKCIPSHEHACTPHGIQLRTWSIVLVLLLYLLWNRSSYEILKKIVNIHFHVAHNKCNVCLHLLVKNIFNCIIYCYQLSLLWSFLFFFLLTNLNVIYCAFNLYFILKKYNCVSHVSLIKYIEVLTSNWSLI